MSAIPHPLDVDSSLMFVHLEAPGRRTWSPGDLVFCDYAVSISSAPGCEKTPIRNSTYNGYNHRVPGTGAAGSGDIAEQKVCVVSGVLVHSTQAISLFLHCRAVRRFPAGWELFLRACTFRVWESLLSHSVCGTGGPERAPCSTQLCSPVSCDPPKVFVGPWLT